MKTVERENRNRWAAMLSIRADGTAGQNRPCSSTWGWKQEKLQRWEKYFLLTSPSIERSRNDGIENCYIRKWPRFRILLLGHNSNRIHLKLCSSAVSSRSVSAEGVSD